MSWFSGHEFPTGNESEFLSVDCSTYMCYVSWPLWPVSQRSCPDSVHVYIISMKFLAVNCRCEIQTSIEFLAQIEYVTIALACGINT